MERDGRKVACEISITTDVDQELSNIEKCVKADYEKIILCSPDRRRLDKIKNLAAQKFLPSEFDKILFLEPEEVFLFLENEALEEIHKEERIKGYKVKVKYQAVGLNEKKTKRDMVAQVLFGAMKRMKGKNTGE